MYQVYMKLKEAKKALRALCDQKRRDQHTTLQELRDELSSYQMLIDQQGASEEILAKESDCLERLMNASKVEESQAKQKSRIQWLREGDQNTSFFFNSIKSRNNANKLVCIQREDGTMLHEPTEVKEEVVHFYQNLLGCASTLPYPGKASLQHYISPSIDDSCRNVLGAPILDEEIQSVFFSLHPNKAPGPDGFNAHFFHKTWSIVGKDILAAIKEFFASGSLLREANATVIALVPKMPNPSMVKDFRPISCCNTIYKCITKILAERIKRVLPSIINQSQTAFVAGRCISDNILLAQELMRGYHKNKGPPRYAFKVDLMKAFDSVRWEFLLDAMDLLGFPSNLTGWVRACITSPMFSVNINGELNGYFHGRKGIRQGDPLSPYLFVICMEVLSRILQKKIANSNEFKYHWRCSKTQLSHLCFADDLMLFCHGDMDSARVLKDALDTFTSFSGLVPNLSKSDLFAAGLDDSLRDTLAAFMGFKWGKLPIRYLGVPLLSTKLKAVDCVELESRILRKLKLWTNKFLSFAGRLQLIKSVLFSIQSFWSSQFILPAKVCKSIEAKLRSFLWKGTSLSSTGAKVAWDVVSRPKKDGGLGVKKIKDWNRAAISRYIWRLCDPSSTSIWTVWVYANLLGKSQFWVAKVPWDSSWAWRKILQLRPLIKPYLSYEVGDGQAISLWFDPWMPNGAICSSLVARVIYDSGLSKFTKVASIIANGDWAWPGVNSNDLIELKEATLHLPQPNCSIADRLIWKAIPQKFSVRSAWEIIRDHHDTVDWHSIVWFQYHVPRYSFILWLAIHHKLSTRDRLAAFGIGVPHLCLLCGDSQENHTHLYFQCTYTARLWYLLPVLDCGLFCI